MEDYQKINDILKDVYNAKETEILNKTYRVRNLTMRILAFILMEIGKVKREDLDNNIYVATIPGGIAKKNNAMFVIELSDDVLRVAAYADEGLIKQNTSKGAMDEFERHISQYIDETHSNGTANNKAGMLKMTLMILALLALCLLLVWGVSHRKSKPVISDATNTNEDTYSEGYYTEEINRVAVKEQYDAVIENFNKIAGNYNVMVGGLLERSLISDCVPIELKKAEEGQLLKDVKETKSLIEQISDESDKLENDYLNKTIEGYNLAVSHYNEQIGRYNTAITKISVYQTSVIYDNKIEKDGIDAESYDENWYKADKFLKSIDELITDTDQVETELNTLVLNTSNEFIEDYNLVVDDYNQAVQNTVVTYISDIPYKVFLKNELKLTDIADKADNKIYELLEKNYQDNIKLVGNYITVTQITSPDEEWVKDRLSGVNYITGMDAVTESNDPNGLLGKDGGYTSCIYFTVAGIIPKEVPGNSIIEMGTDGGGAVEVYDTREYALDRCDYLSQFDGTVLYTGSYTAVGTMVVRTSYKLNDEQQEKLTNSIIQKLTEVRS